MIYSTFEFLIFLLFTSVCFYLSPSSNGRIIVLSVSSLVFYAWTSVFDTLVFLSVVLVSWLATWIAKTYPKWQRAFLYVGIAIISLHLLVWKYSPWIISELQKIWPALNGGTDFHLSLPVGISFFTLQGIAYLVDSTRGQATYIPLSRFFLFKSFFAQLIAGPIVRVPQLLPQLSCQKLPSFDYVAQGLSLFAIGFFKKIALADRCGLFADQIFSQPNLFDRYHLVLGLIAYTVQIWADFSGYTDMGRGAAKLLGINLPDNFLSPYLASSPSDFWKRWHITLSQWIRDYIYIPLGGSRHGTFRASVVLLTTMGISGLWHGANWTFAIWGLYHGLLLLAERALRFLINAMHLPNIFESWAMRAMATFLMWPFIVFGWLIFRAEGIESLKWYIQSLYLSSGAGHVSDMTYNTLIPAAVMLLIQVTDLERKVMDFNFSKNSIGKKRLLFFAYGTGTAVLVALSLIFRPNIGTKQFIYFQF